MATAMDAEKWSDEDAKCFFCAKDNKDKIADHHCNDCNKYMCTSCLGTHNKFNENHNVVMCGKCRLLDHREVRTKVHGINTQGAVGPEVDIPVQAIVKSPGDHQAGRPVEKQGDRPVVRPEKKQINVRIPEDKETCYNIGCVHLRNGCLVVTDRANRRLKLVDPSRSKITKYYTEGYPCGICCIGPQEVAVAFLHSTQVHVHNTKSLTRTRTVELGHRTSLIACHGGLLYCAGLYEDIVYVHDVRSGKKLREISKNTDGRKLFSDIRHIAVNSSGDRLCVADWDRGLVCVGVDGIIHLSEDVLGLSGAYGVTTDDRGHLYVCGWKSHNVVKVTKTKDGHVVSQILSEEDGITLPQCLSYDETRSQLCVGGESDQLLMVEL